MVPGVPPIETEYLPCGECDQKGYLKVCWRCLGTGMYCYEDHGTTVYDAGQKCNCCDGSQLDGIHPEDLEILENENDEIAS